MQYKQFRNTSLHTSRLGLGCMRLPCETPFGKIDREKAERLICHAYENGINYFDTAYVYHDGNSEVVLGQTLSRYPRESYCLASKLPGFLCHNADDVQRIFREQLGRCGVEYFDFYLLHNVNDESIADYTSGFILEEMKKLLAEGKIRRLGFSSHGSPETLQRFCDYFDWDFAQIQLNYFDWDYQHADRQCEILSEHGLPIIVMEPVRGGRLASISPEADFRFLEFAPEKSVASWALRFAASQKNVQVVLSGMTEMEQLQDNLNTFSNFQPITPEEQKILDAAAEDLRKMALLPCTGCRYCVNECPQQLEIPQLLSVWNDYNIDKNPFTLRSLEALSEEKQPSACIACGSCMHRCPQKISIPTYLAKLAEAAKNAKPPEKA